MIGRPFKFIDWESYSIENRAKGKVMPWIQGARMVEARAAGKKRAERLRNEVRTKRRPFFDVAGAPQL
jgi:hypothetical protein